MDVEDLERLKAELDPFLKRFEACFRRDGNPQHARRFVEGMLAGGERRNVENIAEKMDGGVVRSMQKFITHGAWDAETVLEEMRRHVVEVLGDEEAVLNVDETGFPKKGVKSVGVKRQYSGTLGRVDNCQVAVFVNYSSEHGHVLFDRRLFMPEEWISDAARRKEAGVPAGVVGRTKPELALEMVAEAAAAGTPFRWVGGDSLYGDSPTFAQGVRALEKWYVLDVSSTAYVWDQPPKPRPTGVGPRGGRPVKNATPEEKPRPVRDLAAEIPAEAWKRVRVAEGSQGPRMYEYVELKVWFSEEGLPTESPERLLVRRSLGQSPELKFQRTNAPDSTPLAEAAAAGGSRWTVEMDFQCGKGECGLDEYETRGWEGWHHHTCLSMLALWFLTLQRKRLRGGKDRGDDPRGPGGAVAPPLDADVEPEGSAALVGVAPPSQRRGGRQPRPTPRKGAAPAK